MSLDRRMQYFMDQIFPIIWDRYQIPLELTYRSKPYDFKCRDISPELIELCGKAIWVKSKIVFHHWIQYMRKHYNTIVSSPKEFVMYVTYACNVMDYNTTDHYERFVTVCSLLAAFGANFFNNGNGEVIQYIPKILAVFFEKNISSQFYTRGGWRRLDKYLLRQDYLNWHDETQIDAPDETRDQKLARAVNFSKKVEMAIKATYSSDYNLDFISVKDIEDDLKTIKITEEVMKYFPEDIPSSQEELQGVKKMKYNETDEACGEGETKRKIIENLVEFVKRSRSALGTDQQTKNDGTSTQKLTEATDTQNAPEKRGFSKSESSNVQVKTSTKRRKSSKKNKQDTSSNSKNSEFVPIKENLSLFCFSAPQSEETSRKQTETAETSTEQTTHVNLDDTESVSKNRQISKETNRGTTPEKVKDESASVIKRKKQKKKQSTSVPNIVHSVAEASDKQKSENLGCSELLSSNQQNYKETKQITEIEILEKADSSSVPAASTIKQNITKKHDASISSTTQPVEENGRQKVPVDLGCIQSYSENQQTGEKNPKETGRVTASVNKLFSKESTEPKSINLKNDKSDPNNDQSIEDLKKKFTEAANKDTISKKAKSAPLSNAQKVLKEHKTYERAKIKSVSNKQQFAKETDEQTANVNLESMESLPNHPKLPTEKLKETSEKNKNVSSTSLTIPKSTGFNSKKEAVAEIKIIAESLAPKLEEFVVVLAALLWDLRLDIQT